MHIQRKRIIVSNINSVLTSSLSADNLNDLTELTDLKLQTFVPKSSALEYLNNINHEDSASFCGSALKKYFGHLPRNILCSRTQSQYLLPRPRRNTTTTASDYHSWNEWLFGRPAISEEKVDRRKIVLWGTCESGKSTLYKQLLIYFDPTAYSNKERLEYKRIIKGMMVNNMRVLVKSAHILGIEIYHKPLAASFHPAKFDPDESKNSVFEMMKTLWNDAGIKKTFLRRHEFQMDESSKYYFDSIDRISHPDYVPTVQDVLKTYVKTSAIYEKEMITEDIKIRVSDMGGARSERRKWIFALTEDNEMDKINHQGQIFLLFVVSLSEFNQFLREDHTKNRMHESLELFESVCRNYSKNYNIILFFNKIDVFKNKMELGLDLATCFPDYKGGCNIRNAEEYIMDKYKEIANKNGKLVPLFKINATDVESCRNTLNSFLTVLQCL